jgi:hypothetical protein
LSSGTREVTSAVLLLAGGSLTLYAFLPLYSSSIYGYRALIALGPASAFLLIASWRHWQAAK